MVVIRKYFMGEKIYREGKVIGGRKKHDKTHSEGITGRSREEKVGE